MRKLRVVITGGAVPAIIATILEPACGTEATVSSDASIDALEAGADKMVDEPVTFADTSQPDVPPGICDYLQRETHFVQLPSVGVPADPAQISAITQPPVASNLAARVVFTNYVPAKGTALGFVSIDPALLPRVVGVPTISVTFATSNPFKSLSVTNVTYVPGGFEFNAAWPPPLPGNVYGEKMLVKTSFTMSCVDGGTQQVEALTNVDYCVDLVHDSFEFVSGGDVCVFCVQVIAEMAPSPIPSDNRGDELPLGRVVRVRVVEVARAGKQVLLFAENDAGDDVELEWRVSGGALEKVADDVMLWTMPDDPHAFGQVAAWSDVGAGVENFFAGYV